MNLTLSDILDNVYFVDYMSDVYDLTLSDLYELSFSDLVDYYDEWSCETCYLDMIL